MRIDRRSAPRWFFPLLAAGALALCAVAPAAQAETVRVFAAGAVQTAGRAFRRLLFAGTGHTLRRFSIRSGLCAGARWPARRWTC